MAKYSFDEGTSIGLWGFDSKLKLVTLACDFFDLTQVASSYEAIGKKGSEMERLAPLDAMDFLEYLATTEAFIKPPSALRVAQILDEMRVAGLLIIAEQSQITWGNFGIRYLYLPTFDGVRHDVSRLASVLGPEYLYRLFKPILVHITGTNEGNNVSGTGIIVDEQHVLTCGHVVSDMTVDRKQEFQNYRYDITEESIYSHADVDIAVIRTDEPRLSTWPDLTFQDPIVAQTVYTLGYPKLSGLRDASITMQPGAVTNASVTSLSGDSLFLFSAITRPGNSGGPVVSSDGSVVGICVQESRGDYSDEATFAPHYAGVPANVINRAVADLGIDVDIRFEAFE